MTAKEESTLLTSFEHHSELLSTSQDDRTRHQGLMGLMVARLLKEAVVTRDLEKWCAEQQKKCGPDIPTTTLYGKLFAVRNQLAVVIVALVLKGLGPQVIDLVSRIIPAV
jgi:hypothetical protein